MLLTRRKGLTSRVQPASRCDPPFRFPLRNISSPSFPLSEPAGIKHITCKSPKTQTFKTSQFVLPRPTSMNFVKVEAEAYSGSGITVKVFGDGTEIFDATITASGSVFSATGSAPTSFSATTIMEPILRLPTGVHKVYEVEVSGAHTINEVCIGETIDELRAI